jgi:hypothetical protein
MPKHLIWLAVLVVGCASGPVGTPRAGAVAPEDTGWRVARTPHVQLVTNISDEDARMGVEVLEELRAIALAALWPGHPRAAATTLNVVCPRNGVDLDWTFGVSTTRYERAAVFEDRPIPRMVIWGPPVSWSYRSGAEPHSWVFIPMKGVVWQLGRQLDPHAPAWLLLGLGENLVPFAHHPESGRVGLGEVNRSALGRYWSTRAFSIEGELLSWDGRAVSSGDVGYPAYEGVAWALVHWMSKERPEAFDRFRAAIQRGTPVDTSWAGAFPDVSPQALDETVRAYLRQPDRRLWWVDAGKLPSVPLQMRPVTVAELAQLRDELAQGAAGSVATVR